MIYVMPTSTDWSSPSTALESGGAGQWDLRLDGAISPCSMIKIGSTYFLYYIGADGDRVGDGGPAHRKLGVATGSDPSSLTRYGSNPILEFSPTSDEEEGIFSAAVFVEGSTVHLYYGGLRAVGGGAVDIEIRYRSSTDGYTFTGDTLIFQASGYEYSPIGAMKIGSTYSVYYIGPLSGGAGALSRRYGSSATSLSSSASVASGPFTGGGQPCWVSSNEYIMALGGSDNDIDFYLVNSSAPDTLGSIQTTYGLDDKNVLFLDEANEQWLLFYRVSGTLYLRTADLEMINMPYIRQSTSTSVLLGPFIDDSDGKTAETGLTITQSDVRLSKNSGDMAQKNHTGSCTHDELGYYLCPLDATDTNTLGRLRVMVHETGALPVWHDYTVLSANVYDSLIGGGDLLEVDTTALSGDGTAADNAESFFDGTGYAGTNNVIPTVTTLTGHTAQTGDNYARLGTPAGASISADIAAVKTDTDEIGTAGAGLTEAGGTGDQLSAIPWNAAWDAEVQSEVTDALEVTLSDSIPADGNLPSLKQAVYMITQFLMERSVSSTTVTVNKVDGSTTLMTFTLDDGASPTSITRTT